jgi:beta-lactamase regulating signal transducer with metallopeptidase domain
MLWWLAQNTVIAALLAVLVALACRLGGLRPAIRHLLWLLVLIKLVTPPFFEWPWALPEFATPVPAEAAPTAVVIETPPVPAPDPGDEVDLLFALSNLLADEVQAAAAPPAVVNAEPTSPSSQAEPIARSQAAWLPSFALGMWFLGTIVVVSIQVVRIWRFRLRVARGKRAPGWLQHQVDALALRLGIPSLRTLVVPGIGSPFIWSLGRPRLLWPSPLLDRLQPGCRRSVIVHELAHLRRRDHWVGWLQLAAECVWWWNPLFWFVRRQVRLQAELACDAWVVATLPEDRRAYAEALIEVTQLVSQTVAPAPALGISGGARQAFERRLTMIMRERVPCRVPLFSVAVIGVLALAALPGWSQDGPRKEKDEPKKEEIQITAELAQDTKDGEPIMVLFADDKQAGDGQDQRLQQLEKRLEALLKEVQALRSAKKPVTARVQPKDAGMILKLAPDKPLILGEHAKAGQPVQVELQGVIAGQRILNLRDPVHGLRVTTQEVKPDQPVIIGGLKVQEETPKEGVLRIDGLNFETVKPRQVIRSRIVLDTGDGKAVALSRTTYTLPHAKAEALANFLKEHVKARVIETKVDGDSLTITTTPESQKAIGGLIALIQGMTTSALPAKTSGLKVLHADAHFEPLEVHEVGDLQNFEFKIIEKKDAGKDEPKKP